MSNADERIIGADGAGDARRSDSSCVVEPPSANSVATNVRLVGGLRERMRFFQLTQTAITRKRDFDGMAHQEQRAAAASWRSSRSG